MLWEEVTTLAEKLSTGDMATSPLQDIATELNLHTVHDSVDNLKDMLYGHISKFVRLIHTGAEIPT
jgi:hypothetical protein